MRRAAPSKRPRSMVAAERPVTFAAAAHFDQHRTRPAEQPALRAVHRLAEATLDRRGAVCCRLCAVGRVRRRPPVRPAPHLLRRRRHARRLRATVHPLPLAPPLGCLVELGLHQPLGRLQPLVVRPGLAQRPAQQPARGRGVSGGNGGTGRAEGGNGRTLPLREGLWRAPDGRVRRVSARTCPEARAARGAARAAAAPPPGARRRRRRRRRR